MPSSNEALAKAMTTGYQGRLPNPCRSDCDTDEKFIISPIQYAVMAFMP